jgi:SAM-dependent MidA family methyltransferase
MPPTDPAVRLPPPSAEEVAHSAHLEECLRAEIGRAGGSIDFARYMALALYAPGLGYYSAGARKLGAQGDFVTAPEVSALFARCLARQCREVLERLGGGGLLELGAGSGAMAAGLLTELEALGALPERYSILEVSADLRERQRRLLAARLPHLAARIEWLERLPERGFRGVIIGNEVVDALPVHRFRIAGGAVRELRIAWEDGRFRWREAAAGPELTAAVERLERELGRTLPAGYESELNLDLPGWMAALAAALERGLVLLIDYGYPRAEYYLPERSAGTLMCHYRHRAHPDPLILTGLQDITAHVDFTAAAEAAQAAGLSVAGYTSQAHFLLGAGLDELLAASDAGDVRRHLELVRQAKVLTLPGEMGERFKVLGLTKAMEGPLRGFALLDQRRRL